MTPAQRRRIAKVYHALLTRECPSPIDEAARITGYPRGMVYAVLWRMGLV